MVLVCHLRLYASSRLHIRSVKPNLEQVLVLPCPKSGSFSVLSNETSPVTVFFYGIVASLTIIGVYFNAFHVLKALLYRFQMVLSWLDLRILCISSCYAFHFDKKMAFTWKVFTS